MADLAKVRAERDAYKTVNARLRTENQRLRSRLDAIARAVRRELGKPSQSAGEVKREI